ncbi:MAG: hypothetical protein LAO20_01955 [Acidobacteriia bacterium]|nr:hypothetical protein [Terriglobia bacterium]
MFSAFSFGKIIKTILPGAILGLALALFAEGAWALWQPGTGFLIAKLHKDWITPVTAAFIPFSLILGFFQNTVVWMALNHRARARSDAELRGTIYAELREKLSRGLWEDSAAYFGQAGRALGQLARPDRPTLEYYYLPAVTLANLNYLWESYFCWYEFDINSACALLLCALAAVFLLCVKLWQYPCVFFLLGLALLAFSCVVIGVLWRAAIKNLVSYEKNLLLLISGSLAKAANGAPSATVDNAAK